jgi:hypothetical protein
MIVLSMRDLMINSRNGRVAFTYAQYDQYDQSRVPNFLHISGVPNVSETLKSDIQIQLRIKKFAPCTTDHHSRHLGSLEWPSCSTALPIYFRVSRRFNNRNSCSDQLFSFPIGPCNTFEKQLTVVALAKHSFAH